MFKVYWNRAVNFGLYRDVHFDRKYVKMVKLSGRFGYWFFRYLLFDLEVLKFLSLRAWHVTSGNISVSASLCRTSVYPKNFRYLNFGITSFNVRLFGINKNYLLIIKKLITRFNHNFWLLINWLFITINTLAYISFTVTKNLKNKLT